MEKALGYIDALSEKMSRNSLSSLTNFVNTLKLATADKEVRIFLLTNGRENRF